MALDAEFAGDIEQAEDADGGVHQHPRQAVSGISGFALHETVGANPGFAEVAKEVANAGLGRQWHTGVIGLGHRTGDVGIEGLVDRVHRAIEVFVRVVRVFRCHAQAGKRHAPDGEQATQCVGFQYGPHLLSCPSAALLKRN